MEVRWNKRKKRLTERKRLEKKSRERESKQSGGFIINKALVVAHSLKNIHSATLAWLLGVT